MTEADKSLKQAFHGVVGYIIDLEKAGQKFPRDFFIPGCAEDRIVAAHMDLLAANPQYAEAYKATLDNVNAFRLPSFAFRIPLPLYSAFSTASRPVLTYKIIRNENKLFSMFSQTDTAAGLRIKFKDHPYQIVN